MPWSTVKAVITRFRTVNGQIQLMERRKNNKRPRKLNRVAVLDITSHGELQRQASLPLRFRLPSIRIRHNVQIHTSTLRRYYLRNGIKFRSVDLHSINKYEDRERIARLQREFAQELRLHRAMGKVIYFFDEASVSLWEPVQKRAWTQGRVRLPMQGSAGPKRTILGAVGGRPAYNQVNFLYTLDSGTSRRSVATFFERFFREVPEPLDTVTVVMDNHSAHSSADTTGLLRGRGVDIIFTPPYSCVLNNVELCWGIFKAKYRRALSEKTRNLIPAQLD